MVRPDAHTVLLVDDDPNDALLIERAFRKLGHDILLQHLDDGEKVAAYLSGKGDYADRSRYRIPRLILLDLKLPRKSGHEILEWLRGQAEFRRLPVVVLTSSREAADVTRAYELGANSYLVKPVEFNALLEIVRTIDAYWVKLNEPPA